MKPSHRHESHPKIVTRLKRADGHLRGVIAMIEEGRSCADIAQQLHAVEKAILNAKRVLIHDHIDHCIDPDGGSAEVAELKTITRYL